MYKGQAARHETSPSTVSEQSGMPGPSGTAEAALSKGLDSSGMEARRKGVLSYLFTEGPGGLLRSSIRRAVGEELGDLIWGGGIRTL